jgi:outer membrane protein assembly factor BamB
MRSLALCSTIFAMLAAPAAGAGWARRDLRPVTQPAPVGSVFVMDIAHGAGLEVTALNAATGATVWSAPATTSDIAPGVAPAPVIAGANVIFLGRDDDGDAVLTAADAQTGQLVWQAQPGFFADQPAICSDDAMAVCISGGLSFLDDARPLRFDAATGRPKPAPRVGGPGPRELGDGLFDTGARNPERLVAIRAGKVAWSRPLARIFPLSGATSDYGWNFARFERRGLFVGSVGAKPRKSHGRLTFTLSHSDVVGFRIADGVVRWRAHGTYYCLLLPCPGESQSGYRVAGVPEPEATVGLRLVERGTATYSTADPNPRATISKDTDAVLEGFSPATGRARWRFDAGRDLGLIQASANPPQTGAQTIVLRGASGRLVELDLASGARRPVPAGAPAWCRKVVTYHQDAGYDLGDRVTHTYIGQYGLRPCAAGSQRPLAVPAAVPSFVAGIGATNAGLVAWSDTKGVFAAPPAP